MKKSDKLEFFKSRYFGNMSICQLNLSCDAKDMTHAIHLAQVW